MARQPKAAAADNEAAEDVKPASPTYEKWRVEPKPKGKGEWELTAIELKRDNVRIGVETAELLNEQSHNNKVHYFEKGTISAGGKKIIHVN